MSEFFYILSNGQTVRIFNTGPNNWGHEIRTKSGQLLGMIHTDGGDITEDEALKPFQDELLQAIYDNIKV